MTRLPKLPKLLERKIYKTGQTRGADDDVIYQNRVNRNNTVLIPYMYTSDGIPYPEGKESFENGFIVTIPPNVYFGTEKIQDILKNRGLELGKNSVVFYETREDWDRNNPESLGWSPAESRTAPLNGFYVARVPATTATNNGGKINRGFTSTSCKGAGIRLYEYASTETIKNVRIQLEALFWLSFDSIETVVQNGMVIEDARNRKSRIIEKSEKLGLLDYNKLLEMRIIDKDRNTICPLCREKISAKGFLLREELAEGREVPDLTITKINLFHITELKYGDYNHSTYNLGWGHHHCNIVVKDSGIVETLNWMQKVLDKNKGLF